MRGYHLEHRRVPIPPGPPIPTAFDLCVSVEEQIHFLWDRVKKLEAKLAEKDPVE